MIDASEPNLTETVKAVCGGVDVREDLLLWNLGIHLCGHPYSLVRYSWGRKPTDLAQSESFGLHLAHGEGAYTGTKKGIEFHGSEWVPSTSEADQRVHSVNGCRNCPPVKVQMSDGDRAKRTSRCKRPTVMRHIIFRKVTWTQLARFLDPALNDPELLAGLVDFMRRRNEYHREWEPWHYKTDEDAPRRRDEWTAGWAEIEAEGKALARGAWDRGLGVAIMRSVA